MLDILRETYRRVLAETTARTYRFLFDAFDVRERLVGLVGPRGVGKTTLMLQFIRDRVGKTEEAFYASADHIFFNKVSLVEFVRELYTTEGTRLFFLDEVHKYAGWEQQLKNIYDSFPRVRVVFSGSSSLSLTKGSHDLSRRAALFHLPGLSFREYLNFTTGAEHRPVPLEALLEDSARVSARLAQIPKLLGHFRRYLQEGYYPYVLEGSHQYHEKVLAVLETTVYEDVATYYRLKTENLHHFKKILYYLATIPPGALNAHKLGKSLGVDAKTAMNYLVILSETGLTRMLLPRASRHALVRKPQKTFLDNTTLYHAVCRGIGQAVDAGTARELFFLTSAQNAGHAVFYSDRGGDFRIGDTVFEVGGRGKDAKQLAGTGPQGFVVKDDILVGAVRTIPLYLMGFLY